MSWGVDRHAGKGVEAETERKAKAKQRLKQKAKGECGRLPSAESSSVGAAIHIVQPTLSLTSE
jgi:hypothetical protein